LQAFSTATFRTVVPLLTRFKLTYHVVQSLCNSWAFCSYCWG